MSRLIRGSAEVPDKPLRPQGHRTVTYTVCVSMGGDPEQSKGGGGRRLLPWILKMKRVEAGQWFSGGHTCYTSIQAEVQISSIGESVRYTWQLPITTALRKTGTEMPQNIGV